MEWSGMKQWLFYKKKIKIFLLCRKKKKEKILFFIYIKSLFDKKKEIKYDYFLKLYRNIRGMIGMMDCNVYEKKEEGDLKRWLDDGG